MTTRPTYFATPAERAEVLKDTFDQMALFIMAARDGLIDPRSAEGKEAIAAFSPRMLWLFYDAFTIPQGAWDPGKRGLRYDTPLLPVTSMDREPTHGVWHDWSGGKSPVAPNAKVKIRVRGRPDNESKRVLASECSWGHSDPVSGGDIIAFKVE